MSSPWWRFEVPGLVFRVRAPSEQLARDTLYEWLNAAYVQDGITVADDPPIHVRVYPESVIDQLGTGCLDV
jgi:hypothetical protein